MTLDWYWLAIAGLATFRLALLVSKEDGPAFIFRKLRRLPPPKSATKEGLSCHFCVSVYASALVVFMLAFRESHVWLSYVLHWLAISSLAIFANQQWTKGSL